MPEPNVPLEWYPYEIETIRKKYSVKCLINMLAYNQTETKKSLMFLTKDDKVYSFGLNRNNCLALPSTVAQVNSIRSITDLCGKRIIKLLAGNSFGVALLTTGRLLTWGLNTFGQLGIGPTRGSVYKPTEVSELASHVIVEVCCGACHVLALTSLMHLYAWGSNTSGAVGNSSLRHQFTPICLTKLSTLSSSSSSSSLNAAATAAGLNLILSISAGGWQSACIDIAGCLYVWGTQSSKSEPISTPRWIKTYGETKRLQVKKVVCGRTHVLAITFDDIVVAFGSNEQQQCLPESKQFSYGMDNVQIVSFIEKPIMIQTFPNLNISLAVNSQSYFIWGSYDEESLQRFIKINNLPPNFAPLANGSLAATRLLHCNSHFSPLSLNFNEQYLQRRREEFIPLLLNPKAKETFHLSMFNDPQDGEYCFQLNANDFIYINKRIMEFHGKSLQSILKGSNEYLIEMQTQVSGQHRYHLSETIDRTIFIQYLISLHTGQMLIKEKDLIQMIHFGEKILNDQSIVKACLDHIQTVNNGQLLSNWYDEMETLHCSKEVSKTLIDHFNHILDSDIGNEVRREMFMYSIRLSTGRKLFDEPYHKIMLTRGDCFNEQHFPQNTTREAFLWYLNFMYLGLNDTKFDNNCSFEIICQVYLLAIHLGNETLKGRCLKILTNRFIVENCFRHYIVCKQFADPVLIMICLRFAKTNLTSLIASADFRWMINNNENMFKDFMLELNSNWNSLN